MRLRARAIQAVRPVIRRFPAIKRGIRTLDEQTMLWRNSAARYLPGLIRPEPLRLSIALTANCNLRCAGCLYGREFMPHEVLPYWAVCGVLDEARDRNFVDVQLYGGEPLTHPDIVRIVDAGTSKAA